MIITDKYIFFWKENPFCNFTKCKIKFEYPDSRPGEEIYFTSSEQMFMWFKAKFFLDTETANKILDAKTPEEARKLGRQVKNYSDSAWDRERVYYMTKAVTAKFLQNKDLRKQLINPEYDGKHFVEAAYYDRIWGIGFNENDALLHNESEWGRNALGKILDAVRIKCIELDKLIDDLELEEK
ncbi:MAG: NADAR family protein [Clostridia bacterium]|nr:NADAR family protein [Clostridia bacterium]